MLVGGRSGAEPRTARAPVLPSPRGPFSASVLGALREPAGTIRLPRGASPTDVLADDDFQLALYCCYELHYRGFAGVDLMWEWSPSLLAARRTLERVFEEQLVQETGPVDDPMDVLSTLRSVATSSTGPSLSAHMEHNGTLQELREFCIHRSAYQLKEADPHTWAIPRLQGAAKAAMVQIQAGEYGCGVASEMHAMLFAETLTALDLDPSYGAYLDRLPGTTLTGVNLVSMFGLHRRWRGALVGHLALFELTSVTPMGRYSRGLERLGLPAAARQFYDAHVAADAVHELVALDGMVAGLLVDEPDLARDVVFGAQAAMHVEGRFAEGLLDSWRQGRTSLLDQV